MRWESYGITETEKGKGKKRFYRCTTMILSGVPREDGVAQAEAL